MALPLVVALMGATAAFSLSNRMLTQTELGIVNRLHPSDLVHTDQGQLNSVTNSAARFTEAFTNGDEQFSHSFTAAEGGGANVGNGQRFTRLPRADLTQGGQWATHTPARATGPNASNCAACHGLGLDDAAGDINSNAVRDPFHTGNPAQMIERNAPALHGQAGLQVLAEEMTADLQLIRQNARNAACGSAGFAQANLTTKGINFGIYRVSRTSAPQPPPCSFNDQSSTLDGIDSDLVVKPFQWKGSVAMVRDFVRGAMHNELGVQAVEMSGSNVDGDGDGVVNELSVGDITALAVYMSAQQRPTTKLELNSLGLLSPALTSAEITRINRGSAVFSSIGCATCHVPSLNTTGRTFNEPSLNPSFRDAQFPAGQNPVSLGVTSTNPVRYDITRDQPDNRVALPNTNGDLLGSFRRSGAGAVIGAFGDMKRHHMGSDLTEQIDEDGTGADSFMTENLWGVGTTPPYLHDGRATTLTEAILYHTGTTERTTFNGQTVSTPNFARQNFMNLSQSDQAAVIEFLNNLVLFKAP